VNVKFSESDIFNFDYQIINKTNIIVSNPPYVRNSEKQLMGKNVLDFEPHLALFVTDADPLVYYKAILEVADKILLPGGKIYFEINEAMGKSMTRLLGSAGYSDTEIVADINNKDRITKATKNG
jgi:release factor glutamine methyltransferase